MKNTTATLRQMKGTDKKISMITAYDYTMAKIVDESESTLFLLEIPWATLSSDMRTRSL